MNAAPDKDALPVRGPARLDRRTKRLVKRLRPGDIAVIDHEDLDWVSARGLADARVAAVVNARPSITGRYPNVGPSVLLEAGVPLLDGVGQGIFEAVAEGDAVEIRGNAFYRRDRCIAAGELLAAALIRERMEAAKANLQVELERFVRNTLDYIGEERALLYDTPSVPDIRTPMAGRHVLIVVRGEGYTEDLHALRSYLRDFRPVLVAVDGGADALLEWGLTPDLIVGDMDSVSDEGLRCGAELVAHIYPEPDRPSPGWERVVGLGLEAHRFAVHATSEDIAMLLAYEKGAELITAVGTHFSLADFLDKGRRGMASTFLVRLRVGSRLVDARGVSKLYRRGPAWQLLSWIVLAALFPTAVVVGMSPPLRHFLTALWMQTRVFIRSLLHI
ncbi:MAG: hypothetical protein IT210_06110 [Armatimonadetes bacterium]|nr:hypothetical protein [Armatimonadota bacterium]